MTNNNKAIAQPCVRTRKPKAQAASAELVAAEILQGNFASDADRDDFSQAIKMHGVTFLHLSNSPLPHPTASDLSAMGRFARSLTRFWPQALVIGGCHD